MKTIITLLVSLIATTALAGVQKPDAVNAKALEIFLSNSGSLKTQDEDSLAPILASVLTTGNSTHSKINNSCELKKTNKVFKCKLQIDNRDDDGSTESTIIFTYELDNSANGMPSKKVRNSKVELFIAG